METIPVQMLAGLVNVVSEILHKLFVAERELHMITVEIILLIKTNQ